MSVGKAQIIRVIWAFYLKASIEVTPQEIEYSLVLKPCNALVLPVIRHVIDAYSRANEYEGGINSMVFSGLLNE